MAKKGGKNGLFHGECWMQLEGKLFPVCQKCSGRLDLGTLPCGKMYKPKKLIETVYSLTIMKIILRQSPQCVDILIWKERMLLWHAFLKSYSFVYDESGWNDQKLICNLSTFLEHTKENEGCHCFRAPFRSGLLSPCKFRANNITSKLTFALLYGGLLCSL